MSHSNSSLNCFVDCMAKFEHRYILRTEPSQPPSPHLTFGTMAHDVLSKAGALRDASNDRVLMPGDYISVIPSEVLYGDLKDAFGITSWERYFKPVIKATADYEAQLIKELIAESGGDVTIHRELKLQLDCDTLRTLGHNLLQPLIGVIDLLLLTPTHATIIDYKFSTSKKTLDDFDLDSQLPLYAMLVSLTYGVPLRNIRYGYIDIPKTAFGEPTILTNGTLSRAKSQNVSQEIYERAVKAIHGDDSKFNCEPGGYYYDCWRELALNKPAYLSIQWLDMDVYNGVTRDLLDAAKTVDYFIANKLPFLKKYGAYSCKGCEYLNSCKPWLTVGDKGDY